MLSTVWSNKLEVFRIELADQDGSFFVIVTGSPVVTEACRDGSFNVKGLGPWTAF